MTVGIVVVSHSAKLAEAAAELAAEMATGELRLALAGGLDDPDHPLGTDAVRVLSAIDEVDGADGVLVLMDLGSAVLSAELAREMLPAGRRERVLLCEAPLVEGLVAAAVQAAAGADLERVAAEARAGLAAKLAHLAPGSLDAPDPGAAAVGAASECEAALSDTITVRNELGLHARPAARVVEAISGCAASVTVENLETGRGPVSAASLNGLITLGARGGHRLVLRATGRDADRAIAALRALADERFGDPPGAKAPGEPPPIAPNRMIEPGVLQGLAAAPGIAVGKVHHLADSPLADVPLRTADDPDAERRRLDKALAKAGDAIDAARAGLAARAGDDAAALLEAHRALLSDPALTEPAVAAIDKRGLDAESAWRLAVAEAIEPYRTLSDPYLAARAADVEAVGAEVLAQLAGADWGPPPTGVVVVRDLSPSEAARLDPEKIDAIVAAEGSASSHAALVARALGIPAVVGAGPDVLMLPDGTPLGVHGDSGRVMIDPAPQVLEDLRRAMELGREARASSRRAATSPARTADGVHIGVMANVDVGAAAARALAEGADGVGLLRSELLFMDRAEAPDEDEQAAAYAQICAAVDGRPVTLRLLDAGGDKPVGYLRMPVEANPFLGVRGIRLGLADQPLLLLQLRAALRVAAEHPLRLMIPMVSTVAEVREVRGLLDHARRSLECAGVTAGDLELGIMVEVPAAALATSILREVDFISIGTNDLIQYVMAAERGNAAVAHLADGVEPGVLRLMGMVCDAASEASVPVAVCGGLAADLDAIPLLLGLGVRELSVPPPSVPEVKERVRAVDLADAGELLRQALRSESAADVRALLRAARPDA